MVNKPYFNSIKQFRILEKIRIIYNSNCSLSEVNREHFSVNILPDNCHLTVSHLSVTNRMEEDQRKVEHGLEERFTESTDLEEILSVFSQIKAGLGLSSQPGTMSEGFSSLQEHLSARIPHRYSDLFRLIKQRSAEKEYCDNKVASGLNVLIIGKQKRRNLNN